MKTDLNWSTRIWAFFLPLLTSLPAFLRGATPTLSLSCLLDLTYILPEWFWVILFKSFLNSVVDVVDLGFLEIYLAFTLIYDLNSPHRLVC
jgi:hypothetical protein